MDIAALKIELEDPAYSKLVAAAQTALKSFPLPVVQLNASAVAAKVSLKTAKEAGEQESQNLAHAEFETVLEPLITDHRARCATALSALDEIAAAVNAKVISTDTPKKATAREMIASLQKLSLEDKYAELVEGKPPEVLLAAGIISPAQHEAYKQFEAEDVPLWQVLGREVDHGDVLAALGRDWSELSISMEDPDQ